MQTYLVGGAVRDKLLGYVNHNCDRDWVVVGSTPTQMLTLGFQAVGKDFPVFLHPQTHEEYALARKERKTAAGYTGFAFDTDASVTLEEDLSRRDLTINAIAQAEDGQLIDPYNGCNDIERKVLRHVSPAFVEDPVRVLRLARFAARFHHLGFTIAPETQELLKNIVLSGEVHHLVAERVWKEFSRALGEQSPQVFIETLRDCGALEVIMPELNSLFSRESSTEYSLGQRSLHRMVMATDQHASCDIRFALLKLHVAADKSVEERKLVIDKLCLRLKTPNEYTELTRIAVLHSKTCHKVFNLNADELHTFLQQLDARRQHDRLIKFLTVCQIDFTETYGSSRNYLQANFILFAHTAMQSINVQDIIAEGYSGKGLGEELKSRQTNKLKKLINSHK